MELVGDKQVKNVEDTNMEISPLLSSTSSSALDDFYIMKEKEELKIKGIDACLRIINSSKISFETKTLAENTLKVYIQTLTVVK